MGQLRLKDDNIADLTQRATWWQAPRGNRQNDVVRHRPGPCVAVMGAAAR
jgi:hypothetical protein